MPTSSLPGGLKIIKSTNMSSDLLGRFHPCGKMILQPVEWLRAKPRPPFPGEAFFHDAETD